MAGPRPDELRAVLTESQRLGFLGERPIDAVIDHSQAFVSALAEVHGSVLDLGSGGGVPGLVVAAARPDLRVTLLDRRTKRTDFLRRAVLRLGWAERVAVVDADVDDWTPPERFDAVVARGFAAPEPTLRAATRLVRSGGLIVVSEPPSGDRWPPELLAAAQVVRRPADRRVACFERRRRS